MNRRTITRVRWDAVAVYTFLFGVCLGGWAFILLCLWFGARGAR